MTDFVDIYKNPFFEVDKLISREICISISLQNEDNHVLNWNYEDDNDPGSLLLTSP